MTKKLITGRLENWHVEEHKYKNGKYRIIWGRVHGDIKKRFRDGQVIHTSIIKRLDRKNMLAYTLNSVYSLGVEKTEEHKERILAETQLEKDLINALMPKVILP